MTKDSRQRPSTAEILKMPYVAQRMQAFVENTEMDNMIQRSNTLYKKQRPTIRRGNTRHGIDFNPVPANEMSTLETTNQSQQITVELTPAQRMAQRKAEANAKREEELK